MRKSYITFIALLLATAIVLMIVSGFVALIYAFACS